MKSLDKTLKYKFGQPHMEGDEGEYDSLSPASPRADGDAGQNFSGSLHLLSPNKQHRFLDLAVRQIRDNTRQRGQCRDTQAAQAVPRKPRSRVDSPLGRKGGLHQCLHYKRWEEP
jgi:hypothetical protein